MNTEKFTYLTDDKGFWPPYYLAPIVRNELLEANPEIAGQMGVQSIPLLKLFKNGQAVADLLGARPIPSSDALLHLRLHP